MKIVVSRQRLLTEKKYSPLGVMWHQSVEQFRQSANHISIYGKFDMSSQIVSNRISTGVGHEAMTKLQSRIWVVRNPHWQVDNRAINEWTSQLRGSAAKQVNQSINNQLALFFLLCILVRLISYTVHLSFLYHFLRPLCGK